MRPFCARAVGLILLCVGWSALASPTAAQDATPSKPSSAASVVTVSLSVTGATANPRIFVRDVATLEGGTPQLREQIGNLDLADFPSDSRILRLTKEQVFYRL